MLESVGLVLVKRYLTSCSFFYVAVRFASKTSTTATKFGDLCVNISSTKNVRGKNEDAALLQFVATVTTLKVSGNFLNMQAVMKEVQLEGLFP